MSMSKKHFIALADLVANIPLGNILGSLRHLGQCAGCSKQFLSTHERVYSNGVRVICARCYGDMLGAHGEGAALMGDDPIQG